MPHFLAFRPDGTVVLFGGGKEARLFDAATGEPVGKPLVIPLVTPYGLNSVAFSPDSKLVPTGIWGSASGARPASGTPRPSSRTAILYSTRVRSSPQSSAPTAGPS
jgi:hypothetical protein